MNSEPGFWEFHLKWVTSTSCAPQKNLERGLESAEGVRPERWWKTERSETHLFMCEYITGSEIQLHR